MVLSRRVFGTLSVAAIAAAGAAVSARADASEPQIPVGDIVAHNVVLVHGLYADGSSWIDVVAPSECGPQRRGCPEPVDNPGQRRRRDPPCAGIADRAVRLRWDWNHSQAKWVVTTELAHSSTSPPRCRGGLSHPGPPVPERVGIKWDRVHPRRFRAARQADISHRLRRGLPVRAGPRPLRGPGPQPAIDNTLCPCATTHAVPRRARYIPHHASLLRRPEC